MRGKGIIYDAGFLHDGVSSREPFDLDVVAREMQIIRHDLYCTAVRITGGDPERLERAAELAAVAGLEVWFSPFTSDLDPDAMISLLVDCAERAERIRQGGGAVVFVAGAEMSLLNNGFLPGDSLKVRIGLLAQPERLRESMPAVPALMNEFFGRAVPAIRERFEGKVTYAAIPFEGVDWERFDVIGLDLYRTIELADRYRDAIRSIVAQGKPLAITEFGTATYRGAGDKGARAGEIVVGVSRSRPSVSTVSTSVTRPSRSGTWTICWRSSTPKGSTARSCARSKAPSSRIDRTATPATTSTSGRTASSRCSTAVVA